MANQLKMAIVSSVLTLHKRGWSNRQIADCLGIHRNTVNRYVRRAKCATNLPPGSDGDSKCATNLPPGSGGDSKCATNPPPGFLPGPDSGCQPYREIIEAKLSQQLSGKRIYQDLVSQHGFSHGYDSVKRFIRKLGHNRQLPFRRMECLPGKEAQVDMGTGAPIVTKEGKRRKTHVFRMVLSHSRKGYSEAIFRQDTETLIRCLENAFRYLGGVPETTVIDNPKALVKNPDWYDPELNPKLRSFCEHYGTVVLPTKPYTPRHKGKIERGIGYVKDNCLKGHKFSNLADENRHLLHWETSIADTRIHGTTRKQVGRVFDEVEKAALLPLPAGSFPYFQESERSVHRDGHVEVARAYYSAPPEYVGRRVWARWDGKMVRLFSKRMKLLAVHIQKQPGQFSTHTEHIDSKKFSKVELGAEQLVIRTGIIGPNAGKWAQATVKNRGIQALRVLVGLQSMTSKYSSDQIDRACEIALNHGSFYLRPIRELLKRDNSDNQNHFQFMDKHEIIREMSVYGQIARSTSKDQSELNRRCNAGPALCETDIATTDR